MLREVGQLKQGWARRIMSYDWWSLTRWLRWLKRPPNYLHCGPICRGSEGLLLLLTLPHYLLPVFHGCLLASAYTIPAVSGDIPAGSILPYPHKNHDCWPKEPIDATEGRSHCIIWDLLIMRPFHWRPFESFGSQLAPSVAFLCVYIAVFVRLEK